MKVLVSPDRIAYRIPDRDVRGAGQTAQAARWSQIICANSSRLPVGWAGWPDWVGLSIQLAALWQCVVAGAQGVWTLIVPVVGDIDRRWGQVRQLDEREAVKSICNGKVKKTKGGWSCKGGGKIGPPPFPEAQIADGASLVELAARTQPLAAVPEPFAGAVLPAGYAEAIASLNQREPAGDPAGAASSTAFAPAAAFVAACDVASQTVQSFVTSWAAASSAPAPPLSRSISPPRLTGGTSLGARGRIDATIPRRPASAPPTLEVL